MTALKKKKTYCTKRNKQANMIYTVEQFLLCDFIKVNIGSTSIKIVPPYYKDGHSWQSKIKSLHFNLTMLLKIKINHKGTFKY